MGSKLPAVRFDPSLNFTKPSMLFNRFTRFDRNGYYQGLCKRSDCDPIDIFPQPVESPSSKKATE